MKKSYDTSASNLFDKTLYVLHDLGFKIETKDKAIGEIIASSGISLKSWGEKVTINITGQGSGKSTISMHSFSKAQAIDWGKNADNENKILNRLDAALE